MFTQNGMYCCAAVFIVLMTCAVYKTNALICYHCSNKEQKGCAEDFHSYLFEGTKCRGADAKCALQRNPPLNGWVGFIRGCYSPGMLPGVNDSAGCRYWRGANNLTALYCFCTKDYCNSAPPLHDLTRFGWLFYFAHASGLFFIVQWIISACLSC